MFYSNINNVRILKAEKIHMGNIVIFGLFFINKPFSVKQKFVYAYKCVRQMI